MMRLSLSSFYPLNFFCVHGTICCPNMTKEIKDNSIIQGFLCYQAIDIKEANVIIIWGSLNKKLAIAIGQEIEHMAKNRFIIHIRGCGLRVDNDLSSSSLSNILPINTIISNCSWDKNINHSVIYRARKCLRA